MKSSAEYVAKIIFLNGGTLVGKTRLQKTAYFLEELSVGNDADFEYYYYGPYSEEVSIGVEDAVALNYIATELKNTKAGTEYAIFKSILDIKEDTCDVIRKDVLRILDQYDAVSIELAATADFLKKNGFKENPWDETSKRKPDKATKERIEKAQEIIDKLSYIRL